MFKRILSMAIAIIMLLLCFASCNKGGTEGTTEPTGASSEEETNSTPKTVAKVIYPSDSSYKAAALKLQYKINDLRPSGADKDFCILASDTEAQDDGTFEILLGNTNRALSAEAGAKLDTYLDFCVMRGDNKIAIYANSDDRMTEAVVYVIQNLSFANNTLSYSGEDTYLDKYTDYEYPNFSIASTPLSSFSLVYSVNATDIEKEFASSLAAWLMSASGMIIDVYNDGATPTEHEILVGKTSRPQSIELEIAEENSAVPYRSNLKDGKLAIMSSTKEGYEMALTSFKSAIERTNGTLDKAFNLKGLSYTEIRAITVGSPYIVEKADGLYFYKSTESQMAASTSNTVNSTGVRLDFETDSSMFAFTSSQKSKIEVYINGVLTATSYSDTYVKELDTSNKMNRVTLFLPSHGLGNISSLSLDEGSSCTRHGFDTTFLFVGDSITQGWNSGVDSLAFAPTVSMHYNAESIIFGVGGAKFNADFLGDKYDSSFSPEVIIVAYGTNDWQANITESQLRNNMKAVLDKLKAWYPDAQIVGISPIWRSDFEAAKFSGYNMTFTKAREVIADVYSDYGITCIDGYDMVSHESSKYADDVHPNKDGFIEYSENLIAELDKILN